MEKNNEFDILQMVHRIYKSFQKDGTPFKQFDSLYVDECQDFTQTFLTLLSTIVKDINRCTFAGDRTQSINRGVNFNFKTLSAKLYQVRFLSFVWSSSGCCIFFFNQCPCVLTVVFFFFLITGFNERKETSNWHERPSHSTHTKLQVRFLSWVVDQVCGCCVFFFAINALV